MKLFSLHGWSLRYKMYLRFVGAVLPLIAVVMYQQGSSSELPQKVNHGLQLYNLTLDAAEHYRKVVSGIADAIDAGKVSLSDQAKAEIDATNDQINALAKLDDGYGWKDVSQAVGRVQTAVYRQDALQALLPLKAEISSIAKSLDQLAAQFKTQLTDLSTQINDQQQRETVHKKILAAVTLVTLFMLAMLIKRSIDKVATPITVAVGAARRVAQGDLTGHIQTVHEGDEISELQLALRDMNRSLTNIVSEVRRVSQDVSKRTQTIAFGNKNMAGQMKTQTTNLAATTKRIKSMLTTVAASVHDAKAANELARGAATVAGKGGRMVEEVTRTMMSIKESSEKVVNIIGIIEDIAFQTNLLALNAAVEAARAGEQGRGFAVVASEVGNLAQRSATTAKQIRDIIGTSVAKVKAGADLVQSTGTTMHELVAAVSQVAVVIEQVEQAARQQTTEAEHASRAIAEVESTMKKNSSMIEETAAQTNNMLMCTAQLTAAVSKFKLYRHRRLDVPWQARVNDKSSTIAEGTVKNLSATGAYIELATQLNEGGRYRLAMRSDEFAQGEILVECEVVRVASPNGAIFGYGMHFMKIRASDKELLKQQVKKLFAQQSAPDVTERDAEDSADAIEHMDTMRAV